MRPQLSLLRDSRARCAAAVGAPAPPRARNPAALASPRAAESTSVGGPQYPSTLRAAPQPSGPDPQRHDHDRTGQEIPTGRSCQGWAGSSPWARGRAPLRRSW